MRICNNNNSNNNKRAMCSRNLRALRAAACAKLSDFRGQVFEGAGPPVARRESSASYLFWPDELFDLARRVVAPRRRRSTTSCRHAPAPIVAVSLSANPVWPAGNYSRPSTLSWSQRSSRRHQTAATALASVLDGQAAVKALADQDARLG